ncbi:hypothetical protein EYF80_011257 [Liparis tanakae]|uniref:Uncharacterized protein n=1 Tax=Liparis tanakae TaxID=230148 RepID=A0A4Z2ILY1_9TELE|nr:hypothetical protein EYF80_011257 [Liparis tanakae]
MKTEDQQSRQEKRNRALQMQLTVGQRGQLCLSLETRSHHHPTMIQPSPLTPYKMQPNHFHNLCNGKLLLARRKLFTGRFKSQTQEDETTVAVCRGAERRSVHLPYLF